MGSKMGVDISHKYMRKARRTEPKSKDIYLRLLVKLYRFLARRTDAKFNKVVLKRLYMSRVNRPPMSVARVSRMMKKPGRDGKTAVIVGTVTDDLRLHKVPKLSLCAMHVTARAQGAEYCLDAGMSHRAHGQPLLRQGSRSAPLQHAPSRALQGPQIRESSWSQKELRIQGLSFFVSSYICASAHLYIDSILVRFFAPEICPDCARFFFRSKDAIVCGHS